MIAIKKMIKKIVYIACNRRIENPNWFQKKKKKYLYTFEILKKQRTKKFDIWHFDISLMKRNQIRGE